MSSDSMPQRVPYQVSAPRYSVSHQMVTTAFELPNYRVVQNLGVVRGIVVRSRNIFATIGAGLQTIVGGNITVWTTLCEQTRNDAFDIMIQHATEVGANAVIGIVQQRPERPDIARVIGPERRQIDRCEPRLRIVILKVRFEIRWRRRLARSGVERAHEVRACPCTVKYRDQVRRRRLDRR